MASTRMHMMAMIKKFLQFAIIGSFAVALGATGTAAQIVQPPGATLQPPPPAPIPPPRIEVPAVPQMDSPPASPRAQGTSRKSFGDRITNCLQDGAAAGLNANERAAYSRACANRGN